MDNPTSVEKANENLLHIVFHLGRFLWPGWRRTFPPGQLLFCFSIITINPIFITSYNLTKDVWVISDLLLKIHADFQPMLFLVISPGMNFAAICPTLSLSDKMQWYVPDDSLTMLQTSWIVCLWSSQITSSTFVIFSGNVPIEGHPECTVNNPQAYLSQCTYIYIYIFFFPPSMAWQLLWDQGLLIVNFHHHLHSYRIN